MLKRKEKMIMTTRYVLIDFMHLVYKTYACQPLSVTCNVGGELRKINTTIQTLVLKNIWRYSGKGKYPTAVCLEGGSPTRKAYFQSLQAQKKDGTTAPIEYKDNRGYLRSEVSEGINSTIELLHKSGVSLYREPGFEADDYVYTLVQAIKNAGITDPIDIVTNDRDLLPLVDDQVSVYIKCTREYYEDGCPKLTGYFQVTPNSWDLYIGYASEYKGYTLPYNSVLLYKMLHGDTSDNIPALVKGYGPKTLTTKVEAMQTAQVHFEEMFRYGRSKWEKYPEFLSYFFTPAEVDGMMKIYKGIDLMRIMPENGTLKLPHCIEHGKLAQYAAELQITIPL